MNRNVRFALSLSPLCRRLACAWPLVIAAGVAHGATTDWVDTHTKAFLTGAQLQTLARGAHPASTELAAGEGTHVVLSLKLRNEARLQALARDVNDPRSPKYRHFLTHQQFLADYAPTDAQVQAVSAYLRKNGFIDVKVASNRLLVSARGTAGTVKAAFNTPLVHFEYAGHAGFANSASAQVPRALGDTVGAVLGLQSVARAHPLLKVTAISKPTRLADGTATAHQPSEFPAIYDATNVPAAANTTVGIITQGGVSQALQDLQQFTSANGYASVNTQAIQTNGPNGNYADDPEGQGEWDLDSQSIVGAAGGQVGQLIFYMADDGATGNTGLTQAFNQAVSDNVAKVINVSLGWCETDANADGTLSAEEQIFTQAVAQGQTFSVSSGDEGVYECNNRGYPDGSNYTVSWPASSPHVLAIGGTTLYTSGSALSSETVWNEGLDGNGKLWSTGGGVSTITPNPSWQSGSNRQLPDVAFDAASSTGALIYSGGQQQQIGGTSLSAPLFTGFWARILAANGGNLGFPAGSFYRSIPSNPSLVRYDVVSGNNGYQGYGYNAGAGWDYTTGWGSIDISNLNQAIQAGTFR
ncbi:S53 family peptidase [Burkholderia sp. FERM BP-3421]|uniref:S53 family peptidase n=1 Tax=Burkholderia sp. FERM BP-3421 TaxID=1494466 RepID=UPI00235EA93E|nr:S53 family peptidase [Burkholderia sp. FERM BP-3421]WDD92750.1 S53 family peptidase [Burkholderia sp. FERM BP-3421]